MSEERDRAAREYGKRLTQSQLNYVARKYATKGEFYHIRRSGFIAGYDVGFNDAASKQQEIDRLVEGLRRMYIQFVGMGGLGETEDDAALGNTKFLLSQYPVTDKEKSNG